MGAEIKKYIGYECKGHAVRKLVTEMSIGHVQVLLLEQYQSGLLS